MGKFGQDGGVIGQDGRLSPAQLECATSLGLQGDMAAGCKAISNEFL